MVKNHFIIGLGGFGGRSIAAFRRAQVVLSDDMKHLEKPVDEGGKDFRFAYLYIDSNEDVWDDSEIWAKYGSNQKLSQTDFINLKSDRTSSRFEDIIEETNIRPWIGQMAQNYSKKSQQGSGSTDSLIGMKGAGQLRRYGRVLFALNANKIEQQLRTKIGKLHPGDIDFHIFCTLGGGTGSGSIVDMVTLIQYLAKQKGAIFNTYMYPFIASVFADKANTGNFFENEYAALRDLNALMVGRYSPYMAGVVNNIYGDDRYQHESKRRPIQAIYISSDRSVRAKPDDQIEFIARGCLDCIIMRANRSGQDIEKAFTFEDISDSVGEPMGKQKPERGYNFAAIGEKRWCMPTEQIKELLKEDFAVRVLGFWKGANAGGEREVEDLRLDFEPRHVIKELENFGKEEREQLRLLYEKLITEQPGTDSLIKLHESLSAILQKIKDEGKSSSWRKKIAEASKRDAEELRNVLTEKLDRQLEWQTADGDSWGLEKVEDFLEIYHRSLDEWKERCRAKYLEEVRKIYEGNHTITEEEDFRKRVFKQLEKREEESKKIGPLTALLLSTGRNMLNYHYQDCRAYIEVESQQYREDAVDKVVDEARSQIRVLKSKVVLAITNIGAYSKLKEDRITAIERDLGSPSHSPNEMFEVDMGNLVKVREAIKGDTRLHQEEMISISTKWKEVIGSIADYHPNKLDQLISELDNTFYTSSETIHNLIVKPNPDYDEVLVTSIIARIKQIAGEVEEMWGKKLEAKIKQFYTPFGLCSDITPEMSNLANKDKTSPIRRMAFGFPEQDQNEPIVKFLQEELIKQNPFGDMEDTSIFYHKTKGEIRVLYLPYWFPARFVTVVADIYEKYKKSSLDSARNANIYFANIDDEDRDLRSQTRPSLMLESKSDKDTIIKAELLKRLFVRFGDDNKLNLLQEDGENIVLILGLDEYGVPKLSKKYKLIEKEVPSATFSRDVEQAYQLAMNSMTESDKDEVVEGYSRELRALPNTADPEYEKANAFYNEVKKMMQ